MSYIRELSDSPKTGTATLAIENIHQLDEKTFNISDSLNLNHLFNFTIFAKHRISKRETEYIFLELYCQSCPLTVQCKVSILNCDNVKLFTNVYNWTFDYKRGSLIGKFIFRNQLLKPENNYLTNGTLILICEVELMGSGENSGKAVQDLNNLSDNLQCLLTYGKLSDVTLVVGTDTAKELNVHKNILTARSPVFAAMFEHDCEEMRLGKVTITDMDGEVCEMMIRCIYTGKVDQMDRYAMQLLEAADKYQLVSLKNLCEQYLSSNLTIETADKVLILADKHRADELKAKCVEFILENADQVDETEEWKSLSSDRPHLLRQLIIYASKKMKR